MPDVDLHQALRSYLIRGSLLEVEMCVRFIRSPLLFHKLRDEVETLKEAELLATTKIKELEVLQRGEVERSGVALSLVTEEEDIEDEAGSGAQSEEVSDDSSEVSLLLDEGRDPSSKSDAPPGSELAPIADTSTASPGSIPTPPLDSTLVPGSASTLSSDPTSAPGASQ
ncbi:uncharacterized protein A4U43_C05F6260 [Asparagus officinalis]|uniref:Uncharacterized protein n=1 Tax=Asparagus officinalis TaxID=4686 RepID=A0A5P1EU42_ASPOF|nr:uncharacterized protein A4U43_C05F6260 [Asparagus officinalis]